MWKLLNIFLLMTVIISIACSDDSKDVQNSDDKNGTDFVCAGATCETNADCNCDANFCMPKEIGSMPDVGEINALKCTRINCIESDISTCPAGYECWPLAMGKEYFPEGTESVCMKKVTETVDEDVLSEIDIDNTDENSEIEIEDKDNIEKDNFPLCYDKPCKKSDECCDGTSCLPKIAEQMDPNIHESEYCVVKDCTEGDDTTCPIDHTCLKSTMGTYCVKL